MQTNYRINLRDFQGHSPHAKRQNVQEQAEITSSRGTVWLDEEVLALLSIWGGKKAQEELDGAVRNKAVLKTCTEDG